MSVAATPLPFFGRQWAVSFLSQSSGKLYTISNAGGQESLRVTFSIDTMLRIAYWTANVSIYNMDVASSAITPAATNVTEFWKFNQALAMGDKITISGGYSSNPGTGAFNPSTNLLYTGRILQSFKTRENVVDWKLNLRCVSALFQDMLNHVSVQGAAGKGDYTDIKTVCGAANIPIDISLPCQQVLEGSPYSRGRVLFGKPFALLKQITDQYEGLMYPWVDSDGLHINYYDPNATTLPQPTYAYAPLNLPLPTGQQSISAGTTIKYTLIGTPQQTELGVMFKVLMDSTPKIGQTVQLVPGTLINFLPITLGSDQRPAIPNPSGIYLVAGVRHVGDTRGRGDDWFTEITAISPQFFAAFLVAAQNQTQQGATTSSQ
jgi:hypothetical protein